jgi:Protein of unknown function (DUF1592)/Protein of unknown function (DUF1588)/Protein of unknown function (DUF1587)/Protein of unknown function (DUF1585)/Protein of unknown function (DUF1595)
MICNLRLSALLCSFILLGVACPRAYGGDLVREKVAPFMQAYCFKCHNEKKAEGLLNLTQYTSSPLIARDFRQWEHVITFLKEEKMPPEKAKQPAPAERAEFLASLDKLLLIEARKLANDPGTSSPRRLSNAEYNYTIRDLTGVDMRPTASFPVDPASGEGFTNTSEALVMSPNLFKKYYAAGQLVADHVLLNTTGFEFAPFPVVTFSDRQKFYEQAILGFYEQHKIDYATYLAAAWSYRHRPESRRAVTIEAWAAENKLSQKYLRSLWNVLQDDASDDQFQLRWLRQRWDALPAPTDPTQTTMPPETRRLIQTLAEDIQRVSRMLCVPETEAIVSNAGNAPIPHIDRRKKTAAGRDRFNQALIGQPSQRLQWERKDGSNRSAPKLILTVSRFGSETEAGFVILNQPNFSSSSPNSYNPKDGKRTLSLREFLTTYAPEQLNELNFGVHPDGRKLDPDSLVLKVPSTIEIAIPADALKDQRTSHFYADASLDGKQSALRVARVALLNQKQTAKNMTGSTLLIAPNHPAAKQFAVSCEAFCRLFPNRFYFVDETRGISAGFHLIEGFFRDDQPLYNSVLSEDEKRYLDRLWDELYFSTNIYDKMLHGFVFFEREERGLLKHADFNSIREEDPELGKEENLRRFEQIYLKRSNVTATGAELENHPIRVFFEDIRQGLKHRAVQLKQAEPAYLRNLQDFAKAAYRRPLTAAEDKKLLEFYRFVHGQEEFGIEQAVRASIVRILVSPHFCYRVELPPEGKEIKPVADLALASRLSYFLWSSMPDKELLDLAARCELRNPNTLRAQVRRMVKDPKVSGFAQEFFGQWLQYGDFLKSESVNRQVFPEFDEALKQAMFEEPTRFATALIQNNESVLGLLCSDETYVNKRLASHYGIPFRGTVATDWEKATGLLQQGRGGFPGMAVFLTKNSQPARPSPVKRGFWVVHQLLGEHIPAPPPDVPVLPAKETDTKEKSIRELLALHTENATCIRCHKRFDAVGLSMEGFDAIGKVRTKDLAGRPVDNLVCLPNGEAARGIPEFTNYLVAERKHEFTQTMCRKLLGFALGRSLELSDKALLEKMQAELEKNDYRFTILFEIVVLSPQFRNQRGKDYLPALGKTEPTGEKP